MAILVNVDCDMASKYNARSISAKYNNKKHKVFFKLICDDFTLTEALNLAKVNKNILMIEYKGMSTNPEFLALTQPTGVYIGRITDLGNNFGEEDIMNIDEDTPQGVVPIINLPNDFKDLEFLWKISKKYPRFRFCGGQLFCIDGIKVGCVGIDTLDKSDIKYGIDCYTMNNAIDVLETVDILELELEVSNKPEKQSTPKSTNKSTSSGTKKTKTMMFSDIFSRNGSVLP